MGVIIGGARKNGQMMPKVDDGRLVRKKIYDRLLQRRKFVIGRSLSTEPIKMRLLK